MIVQSKTTVQNFHVSEKVKKRFLNIFFIFIHLLLLESDKCTAQNIKGNAMLATWCCHLRVTKIIGFCIEYLLSEYLLVA